MTTRFKAHRAIHALLEWLKRGSASMMKPKVPLEAPGIDPGTSRMLSERSTI